MSPPLAAFDVIQGIAYWKEDHLWVASEGADVNLCQALAPFEGVRLSLVAHHDPLSAEGVGPGGGSCMYRGAACPVGHAERPKWLYRIKAAGLLSKQAWGFSVGSKRFELEKLNGHRVQVVFAAIPVIKDLTSDSKTVGGLQIKLGNLQSMLRQLNTGKDSL